MRLDALSGPDQGAQLVKVSAKICQSYRFDTPSGHI